jgi:hypothetical protein
VGLDASLHSCPPVPGIEVASVWAVDCYEFNRRVEQLIASEHFDAVILAAHWAAYEQPGATRAVEGSTEGTSKQMLESHLNDLIERMTARGMAVFVFDEVPYPEHFLPAQLAREVWWGADPKTSGVSVVDYEERIRPFTSQLSDRRLFAQISPEKGLCPDGSFCPAIMDGRSNYIDDMHLSTRGAERLVPAFREALQTVTWE